MIQFTFKPTKTSHQKENPKAFLINTQKFQSKTTKANF